MIKFVTDSASDIPKTEEKEYGIDIMPVPITVGDKGYYERVDFTEKDFYKILDESESIPVTSHVTMISFASKYQEIYEAGYKDIIHVTISSTGSNMYNAAEAARESFYDSNEGAKEKINIYVIDSRTYSYAYGRAVIEGAKMARDGKSAIEIVEYMEDYFNRVEVYFSVYSLDYAKKSGRINVAAAFVGEVLGLRPIISIIDGKMKIIDRVRGEKNIPDKLVEVMKMRLKEDRRYGIIKGSLQEPVDNLKGLSKKEKKLECYGEYYAGASVTINSGPKVLGVILLGEPR